ncbi:WXG100 family type VII secretion target [Mycolicibacterium sp. 120270]|uniref:WXG100 family type VII secretion target n=1 Tax=Mycolicibacterium sp. 120270 TaxID=3090600 RepID=UPI00299E9D75|nr:WXG100 family type VII secretion target [Mycolicibacterium sp. 120270]MDX1885209.1 WXG100 family type VII secretion target [Mycolicibacterium sp. 120270]
MFQYTPGEIADLAQSIGGAASHLENIRSSATNALVAVREEFEGTGGGSFEHAQMLINSGIDEGVEVCNRHSSTVTHVLDEMVNTDVAAGNSFGM